MSIAWSSAATPTPSSPTSCSRPPTAGVDLRATDLDIEVTESVPAMVGTAGTTTVPAHTLYEIIRKLSDGAEVRLETEGGEQMLLTSGRSRFHLACLSRPTASPTSSRAASATNSRCPAATLRELIERTQFAISNEETRYYLNGIYVHTLEVEQGDRAARRRHRRPPHGARRNRRAGRRQGMPGIIIPKKTVGEVQKLLDGAEGDVAGRSLRHQDPLHRSMASCC